MFPKRSLGNILFLLCFLLCSPNVVWEHIGFTLFLIIIILLLLSARFLSANVLRDYWRDQHETFQDDAKEFFFEKCMHARARAFEFLHIKTCKTNFLFFIQIDSNLYSRQILRSPTELHGQNSRSARACTCARANVLYLGTFQCTITSLFFIGFI